MTFLLEQVGDKVLCFSTLLIFCFGLKLVRTANFDLENDPLAWVLTSILSRFKKSQLESYNSTTDPLDHLDIYKALMKIQDTFNALLYIAFPNTLQKIA